MKTEELNQLADKLMDMPVDDFILYEATLQDLKEGDDFYIRLAWYMCNEANHKNTEDVEADRLTENDVNIAIARVVHMHHLLLSMQLLDNHGRYGDDYIDIIRLNIKQLRLWKTFEKKLHDMAPCP